MNIENTQITKHTMSESRRQWRTALDFLVCFWFIMGQQSSVRGCCLYFCICLF